MIDATSPASAPATTTVVPGAADRAPTTADPDASPQDARAARAAERAGADASAIERLPFDLSALTEEGLLVNVDAQGFGLLDRRLGWDDLGVTLPEGSDLAFRPP